MKLHLSHTTNYAYSEAVAVGFQQLRLTAQSGPGQVIDSWTVSVDGATRQLSFDDHHNNRTELIALDNGSDLTIRVEGTVTTNDIDGVVGEHTGPMPVDAYLRHTPLTTPGKGISILAKEIEASPHSQTLSRLHLLSEWTSRYVRYTVGTTGPDTTAEEALIGGTGVCQDHAQIFISAARLLGVPARYVSGYLMLNESVEQAASHAWAEAYVDGLGWVGFDISNHHSPDDRYVRLATGLDYREAAPVSGIRMGGGDETLQVELSVSAGDVPGQDQQ